ncbi:MAG: beta-propeller domain-containing protein, partial [Huintestinicola sp.]
KQNGSYISARVDESGILYLVTDYSDYRKDPLNETAELENYVPGYFINGSKNYVAPEDISVPKYADNTDYTVVSSVNCTDPENASVKAVLGSGRNVYCTDKILYIIGGGMTEGKDYTAVTSFDITDNGLSFIASTVLNGEFIGKGCIAQTGEMFRIACRSYDENGMVVTDIYTLDRALQTVFSVNSLLPGVIVGKIIYNDNYASIMERGSDEPVQVVDLSRSAPVQGNESADFFAAYVNNYLGSMVGISASKDDAGNILSLRLEMYSSDNGARLSEVSFGDIPNVTSPALADKKAMLVDEAAKVIGIPVTGKNEFGVINRYYVFTADENGNLTEKGYIEYSDITDSFKFERAVINDGVLIIIGNGRIVTVDLDSMTVIETVDFN